MMPEGDWRGARRRLSEARRCPEAGERHQICGEGVFLMPGGARNCPRGHLGPPARGSAPAERSLARAAGGEKASNCVEREIYDDDNESERIAAPWEKGQLTHFP